jgi:DNA adenine methylase Dam
MGAKIMNLSKTQSNPFNYTGSKFRYLEEIFDVLPAADNLKILDPFVGGGDLISKLNKNWRVTAGDISEQMIGMHNSIKSGEISEESISKEFEARGMSKSNVSAFLELRAEYNSAPTPFLLYLLITNSFNNQLRFRSSCGKYFNMPFGKNRSTFNPSMRAKLSNYSSSLADRDITFKNKSYQEFDFNEFDLLLIDPPYSNTTATYNESTGWAANDDLELFAKIDQAAKGGTKFVYFNQLIANDIKNHELDEWVKKYNVKILKTTTDRCASTKKKGRNTVEIMVWN